MKSIIGITLFSVVTTVSSFAFTLDMGSQVATTDGSQADVAAAIASPSVVDGWTVLVPAGSFTWSRGVSISGKGIHLRGAGAGRVIGRSTSSVAIGTGSKTFTTQSGLNLIAGQTLRIERTGGQIVAGTATGTRCYMVGTITSYSGASLVMNITSAGGSGTHPLWVISTPAATSITKSITGVWLAVTEDASHHVEVSGIKLLWSSGIGNAITLSPVASGKSVFIHDCYFESDAKQGNNIIWSYSPRGIVWNCSFAGFPWGQSAQPIVINTAANAWTSTSTMGANDTTGESNFYIEDCDFHAFLNSMDLDDNARAVVRYNLFNNAGCGTHGADSSNVGVRHYEFYHNTFLFNGYSDGNTMNLTYFFYLRGGTGVFTDNTIPDITSQDYGNKPEINLTVMNLQRNSGPNPCWGANQSGIQYPAPRQVGLGRVTGVAGNDSVTYKGDSEPIYLWNNTGTVGISLSDFGGSECGSPDSTGDYVKEGRDYFIGVPKPAYTKFTYPHPLRTATPAQLDAPQNLRLKNPQ